jgi:hypothetical protein
MQQMADGGIAGYDGYDEGGMTYGQDPVMMMAEGGVARYNGTQGSLTGGSIFAQMDQQKASQIAQLNEKLAAIEPQLRAAAASGDPQAIQLYAQEAQAVRNQINAVRESAGNRVGVIDKLAAPAPAAPAASPTAAGNLSGMDRRIQAGSMPNVPSITSPAKPAPKGDRKGPAAAPRPTAAAAQPPGISDLTALHQQIVDKQNYADPAASQLLELEAQERANAAAERQAIARDAERFKDAYKGRESRLAEREAAIGKQKESNTGLALLNAGLAIMSTPGGLATAIGKGAQVGTAQFASGLDKIRSAQERLGEARDRLDDLKLNREESSAKELRAAESNYRRVAVDAQKRTIDGVRMAAGVNEKRASDIYTKTAGMAETVFKEEQANLRNKNSVEGMIAARGMTGGNPADKHTALLLKVQTVLQNNPAYKKAAEFAALPGSTGDKARATMKQLEETAYRQFAPELLQSGQGSPSGSGGGQKVIDFNTIK